MTLADKILAEIFQRRLNCCVPTKNGAWVVDPLCAPVVQCLDALRRGVEGLLYVEKSKERICGFDAYAVLGDIARELGVEE